MESPGRLFLSVKSSVLSAVCALYSSTCIGTDRECDRGKLLMYNSKC